MMAVVVRKVHVVQQVDRLLLPHVPVFLRQLFVWLERIFYGLVDRDAVELDVHHSVFTHDLP